MKISLLQLFDMNLHDPESPFLIGNALPGDEIHQAKQDSWIDPQKRIEQARGRDLTDQKSCVRLRAYRRR
jgi:hypothetical protein